MFGKTLLYPREFGHHFLPRAGKLGYVHTETISYRYRTGMIFGTEKLTVHTGPVRYRTSFGTCSHGYGIVSFQSISRQNKQKKT